MEPDHVPVLNKGKEDGAGVTEQETAASLTFVVPSFR